jgi:NADH-quinone oxidoreductase subunit L
MLQHVFFIGFLIHMTALIGFAYYVDCPRSPLLDLKLGAFYVGICHLTLAALVMSKLLVFEIIGVVSFYLISHYVARTSAHRGASIALGTNRVADVLLALVVLSRLDDLLSSSNTSSTLLTVTLVALSVKSVSILAYVWLPDAMEGPTNVSALLHSATLVVAGSLVWLQDIAYPPPLRTLLALFSLGLLLVAFAHLPDADAKKVSAISTCLLIETVWLELLASPTAATVLAATHAAYKSALFILLAVMTAASGAQDARLATPATGSVTRSLQHIVPVQAAGVSSTRYALLKPSARSSQHWDTSASSRSYQLQSSVHALSWLLT